MSGDPSPIPAAVQTLIDAVIEHYARLKNHKLVPAFIRDMQAYLKSGAGRPVTHYAEEARKVLVYLVSQLPPERLKELDTVQLPDFFGLSQAVFKKLIESAGGICDPRKTGLRMEDRNFKKIVNDLKKAHAGLFVETAPQPAQKKPASEPDPEPARAARMAAITESPAAGPGDGDDGNDAAEESAGIVSLGEFMDAQLENCLRVRNNPNFADALEKAGIENGRQLCEICFGDNQYAAIENNGRKSFMAMGIFKAFGLTKEQLSGFMTTEYDIAEEHLGPSHFFALGFVSMFSEKLDVLFNGDVLLERRIHISLRPDAAPPSGDDDIKPRLG